MAGSYAARGCSLALAEVYLNVDGMARPGRA